MGGAASDLGKEYDTLWLAKCIELFRNILYLLMKYILLYFMLSEWSEWNGITSYMKKVGYADSSLTVG